MADSDKQVLIVDDDHNLTKMLQFLFSTRGFDVKTAANGIDALEILKEGVPDAIILDILMPEMDGREFIKKIKSEPLMKKVPVVVLTAAVVDGSKGEFLSLGACDYFEKPFRSSDLVDRVVRAIEESRA